jgi:hypothetical protein
MPKDKNKLELKTFSFYIKMEKVNYLKNLVVSIVLSLILTYLFSRKENNLFLLIIGFLVSFVTVYRIGEYVLSKKFIYYLIGGRPAEGKEALIDLIVYAVIFIALMIIYLT